MVELIQAPLPCRSRDLDRRSEKESEEKKRQQNLQRFTKQKKKGRMRWDFSRDYNRIHLPERDYDRQVHCQI
ncbi:hypothetical protein EJB05_50449 [Eragrostis curvula]|uniref:Uncharacterized protein n=1 Tax=Eragrostis curvula TaxID=38414 RepID=A0A5J9SY58_9POAL|nr:hypothetical protein EJB05_50449 [Eragrostis curvula]